MARVAAPSRNLTIATNSRLPVSKKIEIEPIRTYSTAQSKEILAKVRLGSGSDELAAHVDSKFMSALVRARKPA